MIIHEQQSIHFLKSTYSVELWEDSPGSLQDLAFKPILLLNDHIQITDRLNTAVQTNNGCLQAKRGVFFESHFKFNLKMSRHKMMAQTNPDFVYL